MMISVTLHAAFVYSSAACSLLISQMWFVNFVSRNSNTLTSMRNNVWLQYCLGPLDGSFGPRILIITAKLVQLKLKKKVLLLFYWYI